MAARRPETRGHTRYGDWASVLLESGYHPLPIFPGAKKPMVSRWTAVDISAAKVAEWEQKFPDAAIGLRTGSLIALDIDVLNADAAHQLEALARSRFGDTLVRVGLWPKRLLLFRTDTPFAKLKSGAVEFLGAGQQFVAFGRHPVTQKDYYWPSGDTPIEMAFEDLPRIDREAAAAFLAEAAAIQPGTHAMPKGGVGGGVASIAADRPVRNAEGLVVDGRDAWLSTIAFHAVHDAIDGGGSPQAGPIAETVWYRFSQSADLERPRGDGLRPYVPNDALCKVQDKLRLARSGRLPQRILDVPAPTTDPPRLSVDVARERLDATLTAFCDRVLKWHLGTEEIRPACGIRATVGLGKSHVTREKAIALARQLRIAGAPHRIVVFTASHALAEATAEAWSDAGMSCAVLRGYERVDPVTGEPMCRDPKAVKAALESHLNVQTAVCAARDGTKCAFFATCLKQRNRTEVAAADVIVAPYDALFSGLSFKKDDLALIVIDEGCWARALEHVRGPSATELLSEPVGMNGTRSRTPSEDAMADLVALRTCLASAITANSDGPLRRQSLLEAGLTASDCEQATQLERRRIRDPKLHPALPSADRSRAFPIASSNARADCLARIWQSAADLLRGEAEASGHLTIARSGTNGDAAIDLRKVHGVHESLLGKPVLHLDATMRPDLVRTVLGELKIEEIEAAAPHMHLRLVTVPFGKSTLVPVPGLADTELTRRQNRLRECVDYVRWHARRVVPGGVLVVTYQAIEEAFAAIPGVRTAHFNAIAGLDIYHDVRLLICIGRPLPNHSDLEAMAGAYFGVAPQSVYRKVRAGIHTRSGPARSLQAIQHVDDNAEMLRAAICDDEVIQVIGRGRGVNRTADNPLEVHVLADVALPLEHDSIATWDAVKPDIVQRMLLAGVAVDSPADAVVLHPRLLRNEKQAQKEFERAGFKRQNPMSISYREMSLKSAAYRRAGRGRAWQRCWWVDGSVDEVRVQLELVLGPLEWSTRA